MSTSRRIFRPEFKQKVLDAFASDPDCIGNQRATARKFGIHRRQVQKWLQQLSTGELSLSKVGQRFFYGTYCSTTHFETSTIRFITWRVAVC